MSNFSKVGHDLFLIGEVFASIFVGVPLGIAIICIFYKLIVAHLINPLLWVFGSKDPTVLWTKVEDFILRFILNPIGFSIGFLYVLFVLLSAGAYFILLCVIVPMAMFFLFQSQPVCTSLGLLILVFLKVVYPRYKKAHSISKIF